MTGRNLEISEAQREELLLILNDHPNETVQNVLDDLRKDSLEDFRNLLNGLANINTAIERQALIAAWWFIENVPESDWRRNEIFFELRNLVRKASAVVA